MAFVPYPLAPGTPEARIDYELMLPTWRKYLELAHHVFTQLYDDPRLDAIYQGAEFRSGPTVGLAYHAEHRYPTRSVPFEIMDGQGEPTGEKGVVYPGKALIVHSAGVYIDTIHKHPTNPVWIAGEHENEQVRVTFPNVPTLGNFVQLVPMPATYQL